MRRTRIGARRRTSRFSVSRVKPDEVTLTKVRVAPPLRKCSRVDGILLTLFKVARGTAHNGYTSPLHRVAIVRSAISLAEYLSRDICNSCKTILNARPVYKSGLKLTVKHFTKFRIKITKDNGTFRADN